MAALFLKQSMTAGCVSEGLNKNPPDLACLNSFGIKIQHINDCFNISLKQISMCARSDKNHRRAVTIVDAEERGGAMTKKIGRIV